MTRRYLMVAGLALGLLLGALDQFVFATALPTVVDELGGVSPCCGSTPRTS